MNIRSMFLAVCLLSSPGVATAVIVNFSNDVTGDLFLFPTGEPLGTFEATLHYNLGDDEDQFGNPGADGLPDKMNWTDFTEPRVDPGTPGWPGTAVIVQYKPFPLFQDEYFSDLHISLTSGSVTGEFDVSLDITEIWVGNNSDSEFGCQDFVQVDHRLPNGSNAFTLSFQSAEEIECAHEPDILDNTLLDNALLVLPDFLDTGAYVSVAFLPGLPRFMFGNVTSIGRLTAEAPEPTTLALLALGFAGIGYRRHKAT